MLDTNAADITSEFDLRTTPSLEIKPRYNIAPGTDVLIVRVAAHRPTVAKVRWGMVPVWSRDTKMGSRLINARAETVSEKPAFRGAFENRRCLLPANGYYEWQIKDGTKRPFLIYKGDGRCFAIAGLWERWQRGNEVVESCTVITCEASGRMRDLHNRMPLLVDRTDYNLWLNGPMKKKRMLELSKTPFATSLTMHPVSTAVNSPVNDSLECAAAVQPN